MASEPSAEALQLTAADPESFRPFYEEHVDSVLAYMARRVYDINTALDVTAESFAQAFLGANSFRGSTDAEAAGWLFGIASRQLALYLRRCEVEKRALQRLRLEPPRLTDDEQERLVELAGLEELRAALRVELERLSDPQREALQLRVIDELPYSEIADQLAISEQAVRARVARGLKALAELLEQRPTLKEGLT